VASVLWSKFCNHKWAKPSTHWHEYTGWAKIRWTPLELLAFIYGSAGVAQVAPNVPAAAKIEFGPVTREATPNIGGAAAHRPAAVETRKIIVVDWP